MFLYLLKQKPSPKAIYYCMLMYFAIFAIGAITLIHISNLIHSAKFGNDFHIGINANNHRDHTTRSTSNVGKLSDLATSTAESFFLLPTIDGQCNRTYPCSAGSTCAPRCALYRNLADQLGPRLLARWFRLSDFDLAFQIKSWIAIRQMIDSEIEQDFSVLSSSVDLWIKNEKLTQDYHKLSHALSLFLFFILFLFAFTGINMMIDIVVTSLTIWREKKAKQSLKVYLKKVNSI